MKKILLFSYSLILLFSTSSVRAEYGIPLEILTSYVGDQVFVKMPKKTPGEYTWFVINSVNAANAMTFVGDVLYPDIARYKFNLIMSAFSNQFPIKVVGVDVGGMKYIDRVGTSTDFLLLTP